MEAGKPIQISNKPTENASKNIELLKNITEEQFIPEKRSPPDGQNDEPSSPTTHHLSYFSKKDSSLSGSKQIYSFDKVWPSYHNKQDRCNPIEDLPQASLVNNEVRHEAIGGPVVENSPPNLLMDENIDAENVNSGDGQLNNRRYNELDGLDLVAHQPVDVVASSASSEYGHDSRPLDIVTGACESDVNHPDVIGVPLDNYEIDMEPRAPPIYCEYEQQGLPQMDDEVWHNSDRDNQGGAMNPIPQEDVLLPDLMPDVNVEILNLDLPKPAIVSEHSVQCVDNSPALIQESCSINRIPEVANIHQSHERPSNDLVDMITNSGNVSRREDDKIDQTSNIHQSYEGNVDLVNMSGNNNAGFVSDMDLITDNFDEPEHPEVVNQSKEGNVDLVQNVEVERPNLLPNKKFDVCGTLKFDGGKDTAEKETVQHDEVDKDEQSYPDDTVEKIDEPQAISFDPNIEIDDEALEAELESIEQKFADENAEAHNSEVEVLTEAKHLNASQDACIETNEQIVEDEDNSDRHTLTSQISEEFARQDSDLGTLKNISAEVGNPTDSAAEDSSAVAEPEECSAPTSAMTGELGENFTTIHVLLMYELPTYFSLVTKVSDKIFYAE